MDGPDRYVERAEAKRRVADELRRIARTVSQADRVILVSHASTLEVEAAALDEEAVRHRALMRA
jgi:agmatine/peptidylarginine deiminase